MSLYNQLFGINPAAGFVLAAVGIPGGTAGVPRFRDAFVAKEGYLVIHTRTGGGNRAFYDSEASCRKHYPEYFESVEPDDTGPKGPWNDDLRALPGFIHDKDDEFDSTYANFYFTIPAEWEPIFDVLAQGPIATAKPAERWRKLLDDMQADGGPKTEEGKRALAVGKEIMERLDGDHDAGIVEV